MIIYLKRKPTDAWHWILNNGYFAAWKNHGFDVRLFDNLSELSSEQEYQIMAFDDDIKSFQDLEILSKAEKVYLYVQPTSFPGKWGQHPLFITSCNKKIINNINSMANVHLWSFVNSTGLNLFNGWKDVCHVPLAFDDINYLNDIKKPQPKYEYDICYIGGRANNGFDEKIQLLTQVFGAFEKTNIKCGFFINKNLTIVDESNILFHSSISLNVHDPYQRAYGFDTNERTFKSLGLTGFLISDDVKELKSFFPSVNCSNDQAEMIKAVKESLLLTSQEINNIKEINRVIILQNHTYKSRVNKLLNL